MADENIGSVKVQIVADYSQLASGLRSAQDQAKTAGSTIASAFTSAVAPASALTQATQRLKEAQAAVNSEGAKFLATIQADNIAYGTAQASLEYLNNELKSAQQAYNQASAAATNSASANQQAAGAATQAATATQGLAQALQQQGAAAQTAAAGMAQAAGTAQAATSSVGNSAAAAGIPLFRLYALVNLVSRGLADLDKIRESEVNLLHLSEATGIATTELAQFEGMISRAGGDADKMSSLVLKLSQSIEQGERGVARMSDELQRLGVTAKDPITAFFQIADTIHNTSDKTEALAAAARVLGASEVDLIGIMSQGSGALRQYYNDSKEFAEQRAKAVNDAVELTRVEHELKEAFDEVALQALPALTSAIKYLSVAFIAVTLPVKLAVDAIVQGFTASTYAASAFAAVMGDLAGGNFKKATEDAKAGIDAIRGTFHDAVASMTADAVEGAKSVDKLLNGQKEPAGAGAGKEFQPPKAKKVKADHSAEDELRKQFQDELAEQKSDHQVTIEEEIAFWGDRLATVQKLGSAYIDLRRQISRTLGELNQRKIKQTQDNELRDFETQLKEAAERARESGDGPAQQTLQGLQDKLKPENQGSLSDDQLEKIRSQVPQAQREADKEQLKELQDHLSAVDKLWKDTLAKQGRVATPDDIIARAEAIKKAYAGIPEVVKAANDAIDAADKKKAEQSLQVTKIGSTNSQEAGQSDIAQRKVALEQAYALQASHTYQEQLAYQQQLNSLEAESLALKLQAADANLAAAKTESDVVKIAQAQLAQAQAQRAIDLQSVESEAKIAELKQKNSFGGQVSSGLNQDAQSAVSKLSDGIANLATQTKGWGQSFKNILKEIEHSLVQTFASAALKQGLNAILNALSGSSKGGGLLGTGVGAVATAAKGIGGAASGAAQAASTTANTAAVTAETAATVASTAAMAALAAGTTALIAGQTITDVSLTANTVALAALTTAVIALTAVDAISAVLPFAAGGDPPVGVPSLVGEKGPELFIPRGAGTIIPADKTKALLAQVKLNPALANVSFTPPDVPADLFTGGGSGSLGDTVNQSQSSTVTNHNTGNIGTAHFNITESRNPRQTVREIANYMKLTSPKYSPQNS